MRVYIREGDHWKYVQGPADLAGRRGDLRVRGAADEVLASKWCVAIGMAVSFGANVRREDG